MAFPKKKTAPVPPVKKKATPWSSQNKGAKKKPAAKPAPQTQWQGIASKMLGSKSGPGGC
jgi:hypothetical protein